MSKKIKLDEKGDWKNSYDFLSDYLDDTDVKILEIGGKFGTLLSKLYEGGYQDVRGIDLNPKVINEGKEFYPFLADKIAVGDAEKLEFPESEFDYVISFDLVEHVPDVDRHFREVKRVLKPGGMYLFQTPNKVTNIPWEIARTKSLTKWREYHCSLHTLGQMKRRIDKNGFECIEIKKRPVLTDYNLEKTKKVMGSMNMPILKMLDRLPLSLSTNLWCVTRSK